MRVTNKLMADTVANNLFKNTEHLLKIQNMISSGKRISKPSDDPIGMGKVLDYRKTISSIDQYNRNIARGRSWLDITDSTLGSVDNLLMRAKEIAVSQATGTANKQTREIAAKEMKNIYEQMLQLANTKLGSSYIFAGHKTDTAPFSRDDDYNASYNGDKGDIRIIVGEDTSISINANGEDIFFSKVSVFDVLRDLKDGLQNNDPSAISNQIELLNDALGQVLKVRAEVGAKLNRLEITETYWANFKLNITEMLSQTEDADLTKAITDLTTQETVYQTSLAISARLIQPSLMNFLR